jgi:hypothetical protein
MGEQGCGVAMGGVVTKEQGFKVITRGRVRTSSEKE